MNVSHIGPVSLGASVRLPDSFRDVAVMLGVDPPDFATAQKAFVFRRRKRDGVWGWVIGFRVGALTLMECSWAADIPFPRRRREAECWAVAFAERHGFTAMVDVEKT